MQTDIVDHGLWVPSFLGWEVDWVFTSVLVADTKKPEKLKVYEEWRDRLFPYPVMLTTTSVRSPRFNNCHQKGNIAWHQDNLSDFQRSDKPTIVIMFIWANIFPTQVRRLHSEQEEVLEPGHVYSFPNHLFEHKTPIAALQNNERWFARAYQLVEVKWRSDDEIIKTDPEELYVLAGC